MKTTMTKTTKTVSAKAAPCATKAAKIRVPRKPKSVLTAAQRRALAVIQGRAKAKPAKVAKVAKSTAEKVKVPSSKSLAKAILAKLAEDRKFARKVAKSPEPFRAMVYESGLVPDAAAIDGKARFGRIITALETLNARS